MRQALDRLFDPTLSDEDKRNLLADPEVQSILHFGILYGIEAMRQLLEHYLPYLPPALTELQRQTAATEAMDTRDRAKNRWGTVWQALSFLAGNLPAVASLLMHILGYLTRAEMLLGVAATLVANLLFVTVRRHLHRRHRH